MTPEHGETVKLKICLVGDEGVGKTSLIRRFVLSDFSERYVRTVGVVVHKRVVIVPVDGAAHTGMMTVWDILGRDDFAGRYKEAYLAGTAGVLAVCDLTRPQTLDGLAKWLDIVHRVAGDVPGIVLANKADLEEHVHIDEDELLAFCELYRLPFLTTSAKTGENVEVAFGKLGEMAMREALARRILPPLRRMEGFPQLASSPGPQ